MLSTLVPRWRAAVAALAFSAAAAGAQTPADTAFPAFTELPVAGGEWERYARALQLIGQVAPRPWSLRGFGPAELAALAPRDARHPWARRSIPRRAARPTLRLVPPELRALYNSALPFGQNDGAVWAGRGATVAASAGVVGTLGPLTVTLAPTYFAAQNRAFDLVANGEAGAGRFRDGYWPEVIDLPQRFGDGTYARLDWGQSGARLDLAGVAAGLSTASQVWGPAVEHPVILGANAPGFVHAFVGTSRPVDVWIGRVHGRLIGGRLEQTEYAAIDTVTRRFASGLVATFAPRGLPGLEIGGSRFFHLAWPDGGPGRDELLKPFEEFLKAGLGTDDNPTGTDPDNQLASLFARWAFPGRGFEVYAEFGREDHNQDGRDLALQPDHDAAFLLGFQRAWGSPTRLVVARAEVLNSRQSHVEQVRAQLPFYVHSYLRQGHTHRGQTLGSVGTFGGGAAVLAADLYRPAGRWSVGWSRVMRAELKTEKPNGLVDPGRAHVQHALGVDGVVFRARYEIAAGLTLVKEFNRGFSDDAFNANASVGIRARW